MTSKLFDKVVNKTLSQSREVLTVKAKEYRRNDNPFHNFEVGAMKTNQTREQIIRSFALKHEISIEDIVNDIAEGKLPNKAIVDEKITDAINYLIILKASILDRLANKSYFKEDEERMKIIAQNGNTGEHYEDV